MLQPVVSRKRFVRWSIGAAATLTALLVAWLALRPSHVVVELAQHGIQATFRTQNLLVDDHAQVNGTITLQTGIGQPALFTTTHPATADGKNICVGGGCQLLAVDPVGVYTASRNVSLGIDALSDNVSGYDNIAIGTDALQHNIGINAGLGPNQGHDNVAIGNHAMLANLIGEDNIAIGGGALALNQLSRNNVAIGFQALAANTAQENIAIGTNALLANTTGTQNIAIGVTLIANQTGGNNIVMGHDSMGSCIACNDNIAIGVDVLQNNNSVQNVGIGTFALRVNTGFNNIGLGIAAGFQATTGNNNTFLGAQTGQGITTGTSNTIVGANVTGLAASTSNNVIIADGDGNIRLQDNSTTLFTTEKVGIGGATAPAYAAASKNWITSGVAGTTTDQLTIDSESIVGNTIDLDSILIHNSGTFDTTAASRTATGLRIIVDPTESAGANLLNNLGLYLDVNNGDTNVAIWSHHGTNRFDETVLAEDMQASSLALSNAGPATVLSVNTNKFTVDDLGQATATGLMTLSNTTESLWTEGRTYLGGNVKGDTVYVSGGSINFGYEQNATDHLFLNFTGYHGGFAQARDLRVSDGMGDQIWTIEGESGHEVYTGEGHTAPTKSASCDTGGGSSITGTDNLFRVITGTGSTACTITFGHTWGTAPVCTVYPQGTAILPTGAPTATTLAWTTSAASTTYDVRCGGLPGSQ